MKKYLRPLIFLFLFFQSTIVSSQNHDLILGLEFGGGIRSLHGEVESLSVGEISAGIGVASGLSLQKYLSNEFSIITSLLFARKGARSLWQEFDGNGNVLISQRGMVNFTYISMPLLFRYEFGQKIKYFMNMGPFISTLLGHPFSRFSLDFRDSFNSLDWGLSSGIGGQIPINDKLLFSLEVRNDLGLHDMSDFSFSRISSGPLQTRSTNLLFGVFWVLK